MRKYESSRTITHPGNLVTVGATEPVLTVLDVNGFRLEEMFLIGLNQDCGRIVLDSEQRAHEAAAALEPAYKVTVGPYGPDGRDWSAAYSRRDIDGTERSRFITDIVLEDGTAALRDGRWLR